MNPVKSCEKALENELEKCIPALKELAIVSKRDQTLISRNDKKSLTASVNCAGGDCELSIFLVETNDEFSLYPKRGKKPWETPNSELITMLADIREQAGRKLVQDQ